MAEHILAGIKGEKSAEQYLIKQGYVLLERNYRNKKGEIDLIVKKNNLLVFVEVKFRKSNKFGYPETAINLKKEKKIIETAENYIFETDWRGDLRFDIVSVSKEEIYHIEDAFS